MTAADAAGLIFDVLADAVDTGLSQKEIIHLTGLTPKQFGKGTTYLREHICAQNEEPYTYDPKDNVYRLNTNFEPVEEYWLYRLNIAATQLKRLLDGTASPAKAKFGGQKIARMHRHTENLILDLADIIGASEHAGVH